jgi:hypothetical protein
MVACRLAHQLGEGVVYVCTVRTRPFRHPSSYPLMGAIFVEAGRTRRSLTVRWLSVARFTRHAIIRFAERYVERLAIRSEALERELARFRAEAYCPGFNWNGRHFPRIRALASENFNQATLINREEAAQITSGGIRPKPDRFYWSAGPAAGVWVAHWAGGNRELILTFLALGEDPFGLEEHELVLMTEPVI